MRGVAIRATPTFVLSSGDALTAPFKLTDRVNDLSLLPALPVWKIRSYAEARGLGGQVWAAHSAVRAYEREKEVSGSVCGFSAPAGQFVEFEVRRDGDKPNWRETLVCPVTGLNNRVRAAYHLFMADQRPTPDARIFLTEQTTPFYRHMRSLFAGAVGSEYLPHIARGETDDRGFRNEDLTQLTFPDEHFDAILTFDVLEHVPDYVAALNECARVLKSGGRAYITVPFTYEATTTVRARVSADGRTEHLREPEYHGDPIGSGRVLAYYNFGYSLIEDMKRAGFSDAYVCLYGSIEFGYLGAMQAMIVGVR